MCMSGIGHLDNLCGSAAEPVLPVFMAWSGMYMFACSTARLDALHPCMIGVQRKHCCNACVFVYLIVCLSC